MTRDRLSRLRDPILISWALCALLFLATLPLPRVDGRLIGSDGTYYYAILRSVVHDGDLDFRNEYAALDIHPGTPTATGLLPSPFAIGSPVLWAPFYIAASGVGSLLRAIGVNVPGGGYGPLEQAAVCLGSIFYGGLGFLLARRIGTRHRVAAPHTLDIALTTALWASPAIYYLVAEPSMSHANALFTFTLFFACWTPVPAARSRGGWFVLGLSSGLAALTRWQDAILLVLPAMEIAWQLSGRRLSPWRALEASMVLAAGFALAIAPQFWMWKVIYGTPLLIPQGNDFIQWSHPHLLESLFSTRHGLLSWHPVLILALLGVARMDRGARPLALGIATVFVLMWYVNASVGRWWADDAFGGRRYLGMIPVLGLGLAAWLERSGRPIRGPSRAVIALLAALIVWNGLSAAQYRLGLIPRDQALSLRQMTLDRLLLPVELLRRRLD